MSVPGAAPASVSGLSVRLGGRMVLEHVDLTARAGEFVALTGPNGSGKTTLLRTLLGFLPPATGQLRLGGEAVTGLRPRERARRAAWVPQQELPGVNLSVEAYVLFGRYAHLALFAAESAEDRARATEALRTVDLADRALEPIYTLSGGERQRAQLARALAQDAPLLLLDEPTAHLDMGHQLDLLSRVRDLCHTRGTSAVAALHDLNLAARFADRIVVLSHGRKVADGPAASVLSEELLMDVWGVQAELRHDRESGLPYLVPSLPRRRPPGAGEAGGKATVHVVGGGGSAAAILRALVDAGHSVTAGVTSVFDTDTEVALALRVPTVVELPFAPIGEEAQRRLDSLLADCAAIVVAPFPVGPGNMANLREVALWADRRRVFLVEGAAGQAQDFTGGQGEEVRRQLRGAGATSVGSAEELLRRLAEPGGPGAPSPPDGSPGAPAAPARAARR